MVKFLCRVLMLSNKKINLVYKEIIELYNLKILLKY